MDDYDTNISSYVFESIDETTGEVHVEVYKNDNEYLDIKDSLQRIGNQIYHADMLMNMQDITPGMICSACQEVNKALIELVKTTHSLAYNVSQTNIQNDINIRTVNKRAEDAQKQVRELRKDLSKHSAIYIGKGGVCYAGDFSGRQDKKSKADS